MSNYGLLQAVYGWLRVVASGLRYGTEFYELCTSYLRKYQSMDTQNMSCQKISKSFTDHYECLRVVTSCDELFTDPSELFTDAYERLRVGNM